MRATIDKAGRLVIPKRLRDEIGLRAGDSRSLDPGPAASLLDELGSLGIAGGAVNDALVGACAKAHGLALATRDRRALETYRALDVRVELLAA